MSEIKKQVTKGVIDVAKKDVNNLLILVMAFIFGATLWIFWSSFRDLLKLENRNLQLLIEIKERQKTIIYKCGGKYDNGY